MMALSCLSVSGWTLILFFPMNSILYFGCLWIEEVLSTNEDVRAVGWDAISSSVRVPLHTPVQLVGEAWSSRHGPGLARLWTLLCQGA